MLILSAALADLEKLSLIDFKILVAGFGHCSQLRSILNDVMRHRMRHGFHWLHCLKVLSGTAQTQGDLLAFSGTGGQLISAR